MFSKKTIANILSIALFSNIVINNFSINEVLANVKKVKIEDGVFWANNPEKFELVKSVFDRPLVVSIR